MTIAGRRKAPLLLTPWHRPLYTTRGVQSLLIVAIHGVRTRPSKPLKFESPSDPDRVSCAVAAGPSGEGRATTTLPPLPCVSLPPPRRRVSLLSRETVQRSMTMAICYSSACSCARHQTLRSILATSLVNPWLHHALSSHILQVKL